VWLPTFLVGLESYISILRVPQEDNKLTPNMDQHRSYILIYRFISYLVTRHVHN